VLVRRDNRQKYFVPLDELETAIPKALDDLRAALYQKALENRERRTWAARDLKEMKEIADRDNGFIKAMWCGDTECELKLKEVAGVTSRCMPFEQEQVSDVCVCCGKPAKKMVIWGKAY